MKAINRLRQFIVGLGMGHGAGKNRAAKQGAWRQRNSQTVAGDPSTTALMRAIKQKRKTYPLVGPAIGAKELNHRLIEAMKDERGVHVESLLCALGALAGYACQANLRAQALAKGLPENAAFIVVEGKNGKKYFFGEPLNQLLAESTFSVWSLAAGAAERAGCKEFPDITAILKRVIRSVGGEGFGMPRFPDNHQAGDIPINYLKALWPNVLLVVKQFCQSPGEWSILFGLAIQDIIEMGKEAIAPGIALSIVMESAIPMSKIDLDSA